jgi:hypothetical protein
MGLRLACINDLPVSVLERICDVLAATDDGLTGTEIAKLLSQLAISDPMPTMTKRKRLFEALKQRQERDRCANNAVALSGRIVYFLPPLHLMVISCSGSPVAGGSFNARRFLRRTLDRAATFP